MFNQHTDQILNNIKHKMQSSQDVMYKELSTIRTDITNPHILDKLQVMYYGVKTPLKQLCSISIFKNNQLNIQPYENSLIPQIKKSILASDLGINPIIDNVMIKLIFPPLTEDVRKQLIKKVEKVSENFKIVIRNIRRESNDKIKKLALPKDLELSFLKKIQDLTDKYIDLTDTKINDKKKELLKI